MTFIPISLAVEDELSEAILRKIITQSKRPYAVGYCYSGGGFGYLKKNISGFNKAARGTPFLVLTDLDSSECAPCKISSWLSEAKHSNLIFRIAVQEVESWILADRNEFAKFLLISKDLIPSNADAISNPKEFLVALARKSKKRVLRDDIPPPLGSTAKQGPDYNRHLIHFVNSQWNRESAKQNSNSLKRAIDAIQSFMPQWQQA